MIQKYNRWLAIWRLKRKYEYLIEVDRLMEEFVTSTILEGGSAEFVAKQRQQLVHLQNEQMSKNKLLDFLKGIK